MNLHPVFVHFPVACLSIYAALELIPFKKIRAWEQLLFIKSAFLFIGLAGAGMAILTGDAAQEFWGVYNATARLHERFAQITILIFGLLTLHSAIELIGRVRTPSFSLSNYPELEAFLGAINKFFPAPFVIALALAGGAAITATGALGGLMVYGPDVDPMVSIIAKLFHLLPGQ